MLRLRQRVVYHLHTRCASSMLLLNCTPAAPTAPRNPARSTPAHPDSGREVRTSRRDTYPSIGRLLASSMWSRAAFCKTSDNWRTGQQRHAELAQLKLVSRLPRVHHLGLIFGDMGLGTQTHIDHLKAVISAAQSITNLSLDYSVHKNHTVLQTMQALQANMRNIRSLRLTSWKSTSSTILECLPSALQVLEVEIPYVLSVALIRKLVDLAYLPKLA